MVRNFQYLVLPMFQQRSRSYFKLVLGENGLLYLHGVHGSF